jgi:hypothetical protein
MPNMFKKIAVIIALSVFAALPTTAHAAFTFTVSQVGNNVVVNGSGSLITTGLTSVGGASGITAQIAPDIGFLYSGGGGSITFFSGITGPAMFSSNSARIFGSGTGNPVAVDQGTFLYVPAGYTSGAPLVTSATFTNVTLAQLFNQAQYTYTWGSGATFDTLTINVVPVPEPATWAAGVGCVAIVGLSLRPRLQRKRVRP